LHRGAEPAPRIFIWEGIEVSAEYTNKELIEAIYDVRDRVTRIEESLKRTEKLEDKIDEAYDKAIEAKDVGEDALALAKANREKIESMQSTSKWLLGFLVTALLAVVGQYFGIGVK
jgi:hypothetical protein